MWANDTILNFLGKSSPTDIPVKEVLIRVMSNISWRLTETDLETLTSLCAYGKYTVQKISTVFDTCFQHK